MKLREILLSLYEIYYGESFTMKNRQKSPIDLYKKIESYDSITGDREAIRWTWNMLLSVDYSDFFLNFVIIVLINVTLSIGFH